MKNISINAFKKLVKIKATEYQFARLMSLKQGHSKMENLQYSKLQLQEYLKLGNLNASEAKVIFKYRTRMASYGENYRENQIHVSCPLCGVHLDNQVMAFTNCSIVRENVTVEGVYEEIFKPVIPRKTIQTILNIEKVREDYVKKI